MASIAFDDGSAATLASPRPTPADRFFSYVPDVDEVGPKRTTLGDQRAHVFSFATVYFARLEIRHLPPSSLAVALRLKRHLINGGDVTVTTDDTDTNEYTCRVRPGTVPEIENADDSRLHFTFRTDLLADDPILVDYSG